MRKLTKLSFSAAPLALSMAFVSGPAFAQEAEDEVEIVEEEEEKAEESRGIIVTGSRIRRPEVSSTVPVTSLSAGEIIDNADISLGDALNDLPALRSTFSQGNSNRFIGTSGLSLLDLRGLGTDRTLVLINGHRHVAASPGDFRVDVNTIPFELLERIDIVTGGNSAIYGSDAIAGVVNFVLRDDYEGIRFTGQAGLTDRGDRANNFLGVIAGKNFADGRGNITLTAEYAEATALFNNERDEFTGAVSGRTQFNRGPGPVTFPLFNNIRNGNIFNGTLISGISCPGTLTVAQAQNDPRCAIDGDGLVLDTRRAGASPFEASRFTFDDNGRLVRDVPEVDLRPFGSNNTIGGGGSTLRETGQLAPELERYTFNILARYEFSSAAEFYAEAKYSTLDGVQEGQPSFRFNNSLIRQDNAFLNPADRDMIFNTLLPGATSFRFTRFNIDFGGRSEINERNTFRIVGGLRGEFNDDWSYDISVNYGRLDTFLISQNQLIPANFNQAIDAVVAPDGSIQCRINVDADTTNDNAACVPLNIFGTFNGSQAAIDFVNFDSTRDEFAEQFVVSGFVAGDTSQLFELPGGPVGFSIGGEYRRETSNSDFDDFTQAGNTFLNIIPEFDPPPFEVAEIFGEILIPVVKDVPFFNELTIEAAARYSDYNTASDTTFAWNAGGRWSPFDGLTFRGNYSRSVRVPTPGDLFSPQSQNFAFIGDPCDAANIGEGNNPANRAANCASLGIPATFINTPARTASLPFLTGGNPLLNEETSDSYTVGFIYEPSFLPGFTLTADYYNITIDNVISAVGANAVLANCFDADPASFPNNNFCPSINPRDANFFFDDPVLIGGAFNFASLEREGLDFVARYRKTFDNGDRLTTALIGTYVLTSQNFLDIANPEIPNRIRSETGDPTFAAVFNLDYAMGDLTFGWDVRYLGRQTIGAFESRFPFNGNTPTDPNAFGRNFRPDVFYHDFRLDYNVADKYTFFLGVDNAFDRIPDFGLLATGGGSGIYDNFGRTFFAGFRLDL